MPPQNHPSMQQVRHHRWAEMSIKEVEVLGVDDQGIPVVLPDGEDRYGVNCMVCGEPYSVEVQAQICSGP